MSATPVDVEETIATALHGTYPADWHQVPASKCTTCRTHARAVIEALAQLLNPSDLPARITEAIAEYFESDDAIYGGFECAAAAKAAMAVRWEAAAQLATQNAALRRRAEHAEGEHQVTRERLDQARRKLTAARAELGRLGNRNAALERNSAGLFARLEAAEIELADWRLARSRFGRWWDWPLVQWWWYRQYKRADRRAFRRERAEQATTTPAGDE